jgi:hypothetical protein
MAARLDFEIDSELDRGLITGHAGPPADKMLAASQAGVEFENVTFLAAGDAAAGVDRQRRRLKNRIDREDLT